MTRPGPGAGVGAGGTGGSEAAAPTAAADVANTAEPGLPRVGVAELDECLASLRRTPAEELWRPVAVTLRPGEREEFLRVCRRHGLRVLDEFERQLEDLAVARLPGAGPAERRGFIEALVAETGDGASSGNWILLPWEDRVVHLLDQDDYFEVVTNRNRDKLTRAEQRLLRSKAVGVLGLSVGAEAAVAVAQEHLCGHIVLTDFDRLDLSNLNRMGAGVDDLGLPKTTIAARRIAKLDPYLEVTVFEDGLTPENAAAFLDGLDLLIEECDGMRVKLEVRRLARERGLNVVFAGDERGFLSVEPYGLDPDLPPFHGRIPAPQPPREEFPTAGAFFRELTNWLGGWEAISERSRRSVQRVGEDLCGYPQLASEARFAAGQVGHIARRLLLGEPVAPYLGHIDLDELVPSRRGPPI